MLTGDQAIKQEKSADGAWGMFGSKQDKYEKAVELYKAAANAYSVKMMQRMMTIKPHESSLYLTLAP